MKSNGLTLTALAVCAVLALTFLASVVAVPTVSVSFYKNNGYGMGNDMNGEWTLNAEVSSDVTRVEFYLDGHLVQNTTQAPFGWHFNTADYTDGLHLFRATAYNANGQSDSIEVSKNFVPFPLDFVVGIIVLVVVTLIIALVGALFRSKKLGRTRK